VPFKKRTRILRTGGPGSKPIPTRRGAVRELSFAGVFVDHSPRLVSDVESYRPKTGPYAIG